ncbi:hypothetical protein GOP47_0013686 [Adiantum capillus-veneris]|uniref:HMG box domain-containing protein n=1 Tax=Adiantum capillus-veneris TaxID=13818 RepID=A0A9D4UP84_ADICA|nr:hypothetical protein GOP47_0013686 [Adiantum capillus-veneris]
MEKRKTASRGARQEKKPKKSKDPGQPKRPPSAFFCFMEEFRKTYKEKHPENKSVAAVGKAGGNQWSSMSDKEKEPYVSVAADRKAEYERQMDAYNRSKEDGENLEQGDSNEEGSEEE